MLIHRMLGMYRTRFLGHFWSVWVGTSNFAHLANTFVASDAVARNAGLHGIHKLRPRTCSAYGGFATTV